MKEMTLSFRFRDEADLPEVRRIINSTEAYLALFAVDQEIFRPFFKHGYSNPKITEAIGKIDNDEALSDLMYSLREEFHSILDREGINLDDII